MIAICSNCRARYRLDAAKVPARLIRVRCPACSSVFELDGTRHAEPVPAPVADLPSTDRTHRPEEPSPIPGIPTKDIAVAATERIVEGDAALQAAAVVDRPGDPSTGTKEKRQSRRRRRDKSEMLARALVSDILVYNQAVRDKALADGSLLEALGPEIKKSWELYKEKVGAEAAANSSYFKDALNEILADGQCVF